MDGGFTTHFSVPGFCLARPDHQNALDMLPGWVSAMPSASGLSAGHAPHFEDDRVLWAAEHLGGFEGKRILEIGPFEAYNTWQFEQLGAAEVLSVESSHLNFMRCLVVKNALGMRATFQLGDGLKLMESSEDHFDAVWLSGILYHLTDPLALLKAASRITDTLFVWSHYYEETMVEGARSFFTGQVKEERCGDRIVRLHHRNYNQIKGATFSGGEADFSYWMERADIIGVLNDLGYDEITIGVDHPGNPHGGAFYFLARRSNQSDLDG